MNDLRSYKQRIHLKLQSAVHSFIRKPLQSMTLYYNHCVVAMKVIHNGLVMPWYSKSYVRPLHYTSPNTGARTAH